MIGILNSLDRDVPGLSTQTPFATVAGTRNKNASIRARSRLQPISAQIDCSRIRTSSCIRSNNRPIGECDLLRCNIDRCRRPGAKVLRAAVSTCSPMRDGAMVGMATSVTLATISVLLNETWSTALPAGPAMEIVPAPPCPVLLLAMVTGAAPLTGTPAISALLRSVRASIVISPALVPLVVEAVMARSITQSHFVCLYGDVSVVSRGRCQ